jgi:hypothetical protein
LWRRSHHQQGHDGCASRGCCRRSRVSASRSRRRLHHLLVGTNVVIDSVEKVKLVQKVAVPWTARTTRLNRHHHQSTRWLFSSHENDSIRIQPAWIRGSMMRRMMIMLMLCQQQCCRSIGRDIHCDSTQFTKDPYNNPPPSEIQQAYHTSATHTPLSLRFFAD